MKDKRSLYEVVIENLLPENVPSELKPSLQYIKQLCEKYELVSFSHKKKALEEIKE